jgi:hypothetical protein
MSEERIVSALRALAESERDKEASPEVETRLRRAFRRRLAVRMWRRAGLLATAAAVVAAVAFHAWQQRRDRMPAVATAAPSMQQAPAIQVAPVVARRMRRPSPRPREIVTEFFPLIDVAPDFGRGEWVRVRVPAETMLSVGLPVREDRLADPVEADLLIGEEGLARAIRFVRVQ